MKTISHTWWFSRRLITNNIMENSKSIWLLSIKWDALECVDSHEISISVYPASINCRQWAIQHIACNYCSNKSALLSTIDLTILNDSAWYKSAMVQIDGLMQERRNSSALAMELCLSCTNPVKLFWTFHSCCNDAIHTFLTQVAINIDAKEITI